MMGWLPAQTSYQTSVLAAGFAPASYSARSAAAIVAAPAAPVALTAKEKLDAAVLAMATDPVVRNGQWGFALYDPKAKKLIASYNEDTPLIPASTTKLLTTETALSLLGEKFRWTTQVDYSGDIDQEGTLNGNLYIIGSGDPTIGTGKAGSSTYATITEDFVQAIKSKGIKKIQGSIIAQTAFFKDNRSDFLPANLVWREMRSYYLPAGGTKGIDPREEKLIAKKSSPFAAEGDKFYYVSPYSNKLVFAEKYTPMPLSVKIADAPQFLAQKVRDNLVKQGVAVIGKIESRSTDPQPEERKMLTAYKSPFLSDIVYHTNQPSDNSLAEALLRTAGFMTYGDQTLESGKKAIFRHLDAAGFDNSGFVYLDGSGLSRSHRITPLAQVKFLRYVMDQKYYKTFFESLPISGQSGTLRNSFKSVGYGQINAKTGTLNAVKTLAGYIKTNSGRTLIFSLLLNNYSGGVDAAKERMERILGPALEL